MSTSESTADRLIAYHARGSGRPEHSTHLLNELLDTHTEEDLGYALYENGFSPEERTADGDAASLLTERVDQAVKSVAANLPFDAELTAEMGGDFVLQIDLGHRGDPNSAHDRAGISPDGPGATWWIDAYEIGYTKMSDLDIHTPADQVARWITDQALKIGSPAVQHLDEVRRLGELHRMGFPDTPTIAPPGTTTHQHRGETAAQQPTQAATPTQER